MARTLIIGDVHGCIDELEALLDACGYTPVDKVVFAGDLVAKGPDSRAVVRRAIALGARGVKGNHDEHVLRWRRASPAERSALALKHQHREVVDSLGPDEWHYLEALPSWLRLPEHGVLVVHAGLVPGRRPEDQREFDLLNMRSLTPEGEASKRIEDGDPWASRWPGPETVVFGHDAVRGLQLYPHAIGLDTGCVYGGQLTALVLPGLRRVSVPALRSYVPAA